jgi:hypothetical protein
MHTIFILTLNAKNRYKGRKTPTEIPEREWEQYFSPSFQFTTTILDNFLDTFIKHVTMWGHQPNENKFFVDTSYFWRYNF